MEALGAQGEGIGRDQRNLNPDSPPVFQKYLKYFQKWVRFGNLVWLVHLKNIGNTRFLGQDKEPAFSFFQNDFQG